MLNLHFLKKKTYLTKKTTVFIFLTLVLGLIGYVIFSQLLISSNSTIVNNTKQSLHISHLSSSYDGPFVLTINTSNLKKNQILRYTMDGSIPSSKSPKYLEGINIDTSKAVNIAIFENEKKVGDTTSLVYILNKHTFPIVSLVTDPKNLWDPFAGIYVPGSNAKSSDPDSYNFNERGEKYSC